MDAIRGALPNFWLAALGHLRDFAAAFDRIFDEVVPASDETVVSDVIGPIPDNADEIDEWRRRSLSRATWS